MSVSLLWIGHASFVITSGATVVYIDPWKLHEAKHDAAVVLVSHSHFDHFSQEDIAKAKGPKTEIFGPHDVIVQEGKGRELKPGETAEAAGVKITAVPAYNPKKDFHPRSKNWLGFVIEIGGKRIYYAGDTDATPEMKALKKIDLALVPVGGTYTMDAAAAAAAVDQFAPARALGYHCGDVVGKLEDAARFAKLAKTRVSVLKPGEVLKLD